MKKFIYITGADGTGKTALSQTFIEQISLKGIKPKHIWLRYPFFLSLPLLAYARLCGYSWYEELNGVRHGYWDFRRSWLMKYIFPWLALVDAALAGLFKIHWPLWTGEFLVCERFVLDMLVDLAVALDEPDFFRHLPGKLYFDILPAGSQVFILNLDAATIRKRRYDLATDRGLEARLEAFRCLSMERGYPSLSSQMPVSELSDRIREITKM